MVQAWADLLAHEIPAEDTYEGNRSFHEAVVASGLGTPEWKGASVLTPAERLDWYLACLEYGHSHGDVIGIEFAGPALLAAHAPEPDWIDGIRDRKVPWGLAPDPVSELPMTVLAPFSRPELVFAWQAVNEDSVLISVHDAMAALETGPGQFSLRFDPLWQATLPATRMWNETIRASLLPRLARVLHLAGQWSADDTSPDMLRALGLRAATTGSMALAGACYRSCTRFAWQMHAQRTESRAYAGLEGYDPGGNEPRRVEPLDVVLALSTDEAFLRDELARIHVPGEET